MLRGYEEGEFGLVAQGGAADTRVVLREWGNGRVQYRSEPAQAPCSSTKIADAGVCEPQFE